MEKKNIKKYAASGLLAAYLLTMTGFEIHDTSVDHSEELCPITRILNVIPNMSKTSDVPTGIELHQIPQIKKEFKDKGIKNVEASYGETVQKEELVDIVLPTLVKNEDGSVSYQAPANYILTTNGNGDVVCKKTTYTCTNYGYGITTKWNQENSNENSKQKVLTIK